MVNQAVDDLQALGFSEYEARAYVSLVDKGSLTGYQLAKVSGVPRPNIYAVLDRLQQRGAVVTIQVKDGVRYAALPSKEMMTRLASALQRRLEQAQRHLSEAQTAPPVESVWNLQGYENVIDRCRTLVTSAARHLLVGTWSEESRQLAGSVAAAEARGVEVTTLCIEGCPQECGGCRGSVFRYPLAAAAETRWLVVTADERELLVAQVFPDGRCAGAVTTLEVVVSVGSLYLKHCIAAAEMVRSLGPQLPRLLDSRALEALRGAGLSIDGTPWLDRIFDATRSMQPDLPA